MNREIGARWKTGTMLLVIDCGNTNSVFALYQGQKKLATWRITSDSRKTIDEYAAWLAPLFAVLGYDFTSVHGAILASVVPACQRSLVGFCEQYLGIKPFVVDDHRFDLGVVIRIDRPEQVGSDRIVNAVAAYDRYGGDLIVIDFGTATTFDIIGADGAYEGGVIAPGINLSMEALHNASALLPRIVVQKPPQVIGKATVPAMESGVFWGYVAMIEGLVSRIKSEYGRPMRVVATGGLAPLFETESDVIEQSDAEMTLRGLAMIYHRKVGEQKHRTALETMASRQLS